MASNSSSEDVFLYFMAIFIPPLAVVAKRGCGADVCINICLWIIGWIPGVIHAWWIISKGPRTTTTPGSTTYVTTTGSPGTTTAYVSPGTGAPPTTTAYVSPGTGAPPTTYVPPGTPVPPTPVATSVPPPPPPQSGPT